MDRTVRALTDLSATDGQLSGKEALMDGLALVLEGRRAALREAIPRIFLDAYDALDRSGRRPVVVQVRRAHCGGCYLRLPPQLDSSIRQGQSLCPCPHCRRLLYSSLRVEVEESESVSESKRKLGDQPAMDGKASNRGGRTAATAARRREPGRKGAHRPGNARRASERSGNFGSADTAPGKAIKR